MDSMELTPILQVYISSYKPSLYHHHPIFKTMNLTTFLLLVSFIYTCLHILSHSVKERTRKLPPGPIPLPIIGHLLKLGDKPNQSLAKLATFYGPLMTLKLGSVTTIIVSSSDVAKQVLQKNDQKFANRNVVDAVRIHRHHEFSVVWLPPSSKWRTLRKVYNSQIFTPQRLDASQGVRHQKVAELLSYIKTCCETGTAADIGEAVFVTTLNLLSNTVFSVDMASFNSEFGQELKATVSAMNEEAGRPNVSDYFPLIRSLDLQGVRRRMTIHFQKLDEFFHQRIEERLRSRKSGTSPPSGDFLDTLLDHGEENGFEDGYQDIKASLRDLFGAGTETTSRTLEWSMAELIHNPNTIAKARSEIHETMGKYKTIGESDTLQLPYIRAIVKETFRLHPPAPLLIPRKVETDVETCGFVVPKNAQVLINVWAIGRDPKTWVNATTFMPERFLGSDIDFRGKDFELIPFGAGRRICPGLPLANVMVHLILTSLIYSYDWKLEDGMKPGDMDMQEKFGITLQKAKPLRVIPIKL